MKFLIIDTYYPAFLNAFYTQHPHLANRSYHEQWQALMDQCFGTADFYSSNLQRLGHEATDSIANCESIQKTWAKEHGLTLQRNIQWRSYHKIPIPQFIMQDWMYPILLAQIKAYQPDVIHFHNPGSTDPSFLRQIRPYVRLITAQIASPIPSGANFSEYDVMLSSFPHFVKRFQQQEIPSGYFNLGFESSILNRIKRTQSYDVVFIGGLSRSHSDRIEFLEYIARQYPIDWWGYGVENLDPSSPLRSTYHGPAWGLDMFEKLHNAKISLNYHINVAENYANNMRLYESTGVGTLLITDMKDNLHHLFEPGKEVVAYRSPEECMNMIQYYLNHEDERKAIALAGQQRTLREHTYYHRMQEFVELVEYHLRHPKKTPSRTFATIDHQLDTHVCNQQRSFVVIPLTTLRKIARKVVPLKVRHLVRSRIPLPHKTNHTQEHIPSSHGCETVSNGIVEPTLLKGWQTQNIAERQYAAFLPLLEEMRAGHPRQDFLALADAIQQTGLQDPLVIEVGCGNGWNGEVLNHLLHRPIRYIGMDYSTAMVTIGKQHYPDTTFAVGDATVLPFRDQSCDILISGTVLMHLVGYREAIAESHRVARQWCVFHTVPFVQHHPTTLLKKLAYGTPVVEVVYNKREFDELIAQQGFVIHQILENIPHDYLSQAIGESVVVQTYLCKITRNEIKQIV